MIELKVARQVGKSTPASMVGESLNKEILFLTLDDPEVLNAAQTDPRGFVAQAKERILVTDEFQRALELVLPLKATIDTD